MTDYKGVAVSPGRVIDPVKVMAPPVAEPPLNDALPEGEPRETEAARIAESAAAVKADLEKRAEAAHGDGKAVLEATAQMAADPTLTTSAEQLVRTAGMSAERAVWEAGDQVATMLEGLGGYMAERVADVKDVRARIVAHLRGEQAPGIPFSTERFVLAAIDLAPPTQQHSTRPSSRRLSLPTVARSRTPRSSHASLGFLLLSLRRASSASSLERSCTWMAPPAP